MNREVVFDLIYANVAHPVERHLPKVDVAGSSPVIRSISSVHNGLRMNTRFLFSAIWRVRVLGCRLGRRFCCAEVSTGHPRPSGRAGSVRFYDISSIEKCCYRQKTMNLAANPAKLLFSDKSVLQRISWQKTTYLALPEGGEGRFGSLL